MRNGIPSNSNLSRRTFAAGLALSAGALKLAAAAPRLKIGHTGITWGDNTEKAIQDVAELGYYGFETFGNVIEAWEAKGGIGKVLDSNKLPLISAYCNCNLTDPTKKDADMAQLTKWCNLLKKYNGKVCVIGPNSLRRDSYDFKASKDHIVSRLNEIAKMVTDMGLTPVLHQHTGTCIETREETYAVLEAADTKYLKFGPDVGQLQKGGSDPVQVVKDFLPLIRHMHLKDFSGGQDYLGYCPLGQGKVNISGVLQVVESSQNPMMVMVELDPSRGMPMAAGETARVAKDCLKKLGYTFRS
jgi:inosose dehydratase